MKPVLFNRDNIDTDKWNRCIENARFSCLYAFSWYLDAVSPDWKALIIRENEHYSFVMPVPIRKKWMFNVVTQPFYCQFLGVFSRYDITENILHDFIKALNHEFWYISSYSFHPSQYELLSQVLIDSPEFSYQKLTTHWLYLEPSLKFNKDRTTNLKRAFKYNWELVKSTDIHHLIRLFNENHIGNFKNGIHNESYNWLLRLFNTLLAHDAVCLWYAVRDRKIGAGLLIGKYGNQSYYLFNAADPIGRKGNARTWLLAQYFQQNSYDWFDFESPDNKNIAFHYESFGASPTMFISIRKNGLPRIIRWIQELRIQNSQKS